jgi:hypothetical protein
MTLEDDIRATEQIATQIRKWLELMRECERVEKERTPVEYAELLVRTE